MEAARPVSPLNGSYHKVSTVAPFLLDCNGLLPIPGHVIGVSGRAGEAAAYAVLVPKINSDCKMRARVCVCVCVCVGGGGGVRLYFLWGVIVFTFCSDGGGGVSFKTLMMDRNFSPPPPLAP